MVLKRPFSPLVFILAVTLGSILILLPSVYALPPVAPPEQPSPVVMWSHTYGGPLFDEGRSVLQTSDGGYVVSGTTNSTSKNGSFEAFLFKTDENGTLQWFKTYGDGNNSFIYSMTNTSDGGYTITGKSWPKEGNSIGRGEDVLLIRTDANGNLLWKKYYGGLKNDSGQCLVQSPDNGYAIIGYTESYGNGGRDVYLIKTDAEGNLLWNKTYGSHKDDTGYYILSTADGGYAFTGRIMSDATNDQSNHYIYLIKTDANGIITHETGYTDSDSTLCYSILPNSYTVLANVVINGRYHMAITGSDGSRPVGYAFATYGGNGESIGYSLLSSNYSGLILAGYTDSFGNGMKDVFIIKNWQYFGYGIQWELTIGGAKDDIAYSAAPTTDGGLILAGSTDSFGYGNKDVYLIKIIPNQTTIQYTAGYLASNPTRDNPESTNIIQFLTTPSPTVQYVSPKPSPGMTFITLLAIFAALAFFLRNVKK